MSCPHNTKKRKYSVWDVIVILNGDKMCCDCMGYPCHICPTEGCSEHPSQKLLLKDLGDELHEASSE